MTADIKALIDPLDVRVQATASLPLWLKQATAEIAAAAVPTLDDTRPSDDIAPMTVGQDYPPTRAICIAAATGLSPVETITFATLKSERVTMTLVVGVPHAIRATEIIVCPREVHGWW